MLRLFAIAADWKRDGQGNHRYPGHTMPACACCSMSAAFLRRSDQLRPNQPLHLIRPATSVSGSSSLPRGPGR